jgi:hypothetical protein
VGAHGDVALPFHGRVRRPLIRARFCTLHPRRLSVEGASRVSVIRTLV